LVLKRQLKFQEAKKYFHRYFLTLIKYLDEFLLNLHN